MAYGSSDASATSDSGRESSPYLTTGSQTTTVAPETPDQVNARLIRSQWEDWENRFQPYQDMSIATVTDPVERARLDAEALANSQTAVDTAFDRTESRIQTLSSRLPQANEDEQILEGRDRQLELARRTSKVQAYNTTQQGLADRELQRIAG